MARFGVKALLVIGVGLALSGCDGLMCRDEVGRPQSRENYFCGPSAHQTNADPSPGATVANKS